MRRRRAATTITSRVLRGLGEGEGDSYVPWLNRRSVPSHGRSAHIPLFGRGRNHCTLSGHERRVVLLLAWDEEVLDIQEQFPLLPVSRTQLLAAERGIRHPMKDGHPLERTLDFRVRHARLQWLALSFKPEEKVSGGKEDSARAVKNKQDLLELERAFAEEMGWPWALVTEDDVPTVRARNLDVLRERWEIRLEGVGAERHEEVADRVMRFLERGAALAEACQRTDLLLRLPEEGGAALAVSLNRLSRKMWSVDLDTPLDPRVARPRPTPPTGAGWVSGLSFHGAAD